MSHQSALFLGNIWHKRYRPKAHTFRYRGFYFLLDLDELEMLSDRLRFFSLNRFNLFSFFETDYGDGTERLKNSIKERLRSLGCCCDGGRILLLTVPRLAGYVFNPISIYYCYDAEDRLCAILYEVNNTFGERHIYPFSLPKDTQDPALRHSCDKSFYVSPFFDVTGYYRFGNRLDKKNISLTIDYRDTDGTRLLSASVFAEKKPLKDMALLRIFLTFPFQTLKVIAAIHYEAVRLWLKGVPLTKRPSQEPGPSPLTHAPSIPTIPEKTIT